MANAIGVQHQIVLRDAQQVKPILHTQALEAVAQSARNRNSVGTLVLIAAAHKRRIPGGKTVNYMMMLVSGLPKTKVSAGLAAQLIAFECQWTVGPLLANLVPSAIAVCQSHRQSPESSQWRISDLSMLSRSS